MPPIIYGAVSLRPLLVVTAPYWGDFEVTEEAKTIFKSRIVDRLQSVGNEIESWYGKRDPIQAQEFLGAGVQYLLQRDYEQAAAMLTKSITVRETSVAHYVRGVALSVCFMVTFM